VSLAPELSRAREAELLAELRLGGARGEAAFQELYEALRGPVHRLCSRLAPEDADDVFQETFVAVHRGLPRFRAECRLSTWVYRIALRLALRSKARRRRGAASLQSDPVAPAAPDPVVVAERAANFQRAFAALSAEQRVVLSLFSLEGLSHDAIAETLGIPVGTAWSRLHHARKLLAAEMGIEPR